MPGVPQVCRRQQAKLRKAAGEDLLGAATNRQAPHELGGHAGDLQQRLVLAHLQARCDLAAYVGRHVPPPVA